MKAQPVSKFIRKVATFLVVPIACIAALLAWSAYNNDHAMKRYHFNGRTYFFIGDSHVQACMNDSIIRSAINFSQHSESFYFSYYKLRKILDDGVAVKRAYLGFSYHNLSAYVEDFMYGKHSWEIAPKYFFTLPGSEQWKLIASNRGNLYPFTKNIIASGFQPSFPGRYTNDFARERVNYKSVEKRIRYLYYSDGQLRPFSGINLYYLDKIVSLCSQRGIDLHFLSTPLHLYHRGKVPQEYLDKYRETVRHYNIPVVDLSDDRLDDSCFMPDGDHVSRRGAIIVSEHFAKELIKECSKQ
jgi:hypothetical protein